MSSLGGDYWLGSGKLRVFHVCLRHYSIFGNPKQIENCFSWSLIFALLVNLMHRSTQQRAYMDYSNVLTRFSLSMTSFLNTYFFSRLPAPVSRNPLAKGLLSIFSCVICEEIWISYRFQPTARFNSLFHFDMQSQQWTRSLWTRTSERLNTAIWGYRWFELNGIAVDICALSSVSSVEGNWNH